MSEIATLRGQIAALEVRKPSAEQDPIQHRAMNDEITRAIDRIRILESGFKPRKVV